MNKYILATLFVLLTATPALSCDCLWNEYQREGYDICSALKNVGQERDSLRTRIIYLQMDNNNLRYEIDELERKVRDLESKRRWGR